MANRKTAKAVVSIVCLVLCCSLLMGTTYAWFTDAVSNNGNTISSGTLDIEMSYSDTLNGAYTNVEDTNAGAIFSYDHWEPGYTQVKYIKLENVGTLALEYVLNVKTDAVAEEGKANLADVIDVYFGTGAVSDRSDLANMTYAGTLSELMTDADGAAYGILLPDADKQAASVTLNAKDAAIAAEGSVTCCIALHMKEEAGNEYQNLSVGNLSISLDAQQYTYENDSFDNTYDENAGLPVAAVTYAGKYVGTGLEWNTQYSPVQDPDVTLDTAYLFTTTETEEEAKAGSYAKWHADFAVSVSRDVTDADGVGLAGNYGSWKWIGAQVTDTVAANTEIRLLHDVMGLDMNYGELYDFGANEFYCGLWANDGIDDLTVTVELRLYEVETPSAENGNSWNVETGKYVTLGVYKYAFGSGMPADLPEANVTVGAESSVEVPVYGVVNGNLSLIEKQELTFVPYTFAAEDTAEEAAAGNYAGWKCDYFVTVSEPVKEGLILVGNYGDYGWIGISAPAGEYENYGLMTNTFGAWDYESIVEEVGTFICGIVDTQGNNKGATVTVELRLTNPEDATETYTIAKIQVTL